MLPTSLALGSVSPDKCIAWRFQCAAPALHAARFSKLSSCNTAAALETIANSTATMTSTNTPPPGQPSDWMHPLRVALQRDLPQCNDDLIQLIADYSSPLPAPLYTLPNQCVANCLLHHHLLHPDYLRSVYEHKSVRGFFNPQLVYAAPSSTTIDEQTDGDEGWFWRSLTPEQKEVKTAISNDPNVHFSQMREALQAMYTADRSWQPGDPCMCTDPRCETARRPVKPSSCGAPSIYKPHVYNICSYIRDCGAVGHADIVNQVFWDTNELLGNESTEDGGTTHDPSHELCSTIDRGYIRSAHRLVLSPHLSNQPPPTLLQLDWGREREDDLLGHIPKREDKREHPFNRLMELSMESAQKPEAIHEQEQTSAAVAQQPTRLAAYQLCGVIVYDTVDDEYFSLFDPMHALTSDQSDSWLRYQRGGYTPWLFNLNELATMCYGSEQPPAKPEPYSYAVCSFYRLQLQRSHLKGS